MDSASECRAIFFKIIDDLVLTPVNNLRGSRRKAKWLDARDSLLAFPVKHEDIRPLAMGVARQVAAAMVWSLPYTLGVLGGWKMAPGERAVDSAPGGCCVFPDLGNTGRLQHTVGTVDEWLMAGGSLVSDHAWRRVAVPVEIRLWPKEIGAEFLIARTGRRAERDAAEALSEVLGGLPLAHEQVAAYCERLDISLAEYRRRFEAAPVRLLDDVRHAPGEYHDGLTVAKTFALAIEEAAKLHPAAEPLIVHAALLAPEPMRSLHRCGHSRWSIAKQSWMGEMLRRPQTSCASTGWYGRSQRRGARARAAAVTAEKIPPWGRAAHALMPPLR